MRRTWIVFASSVFAFAALATVAAAQDRKNTDGQPGDKPATAQQVEDLARSVNEVKTTIKQSVDRVTDRLNVLDEKVEQEIRAIRARGALAEVNIATAQKDINELKDMLGRVRQDMDTMRSRPMENRSFYSGPSGNAPGTGRVRMVNTWVLPVDVVVNGMVYQLMPGQERFSASLPAGNFTYEVVGIQAPRVRTLAAGQTFNIDVFTQ
jgi:hypothetical protein